MNVQKYLKDINIESIIKIFKSDYKWSRKDLENRIKSFLEYIQLITPSILNKQGIIKVTKLHDVFDSEIVIYTYSSLIYPDDNETYGYCDQKWEDILSYEVVVEDGVTKEEAQADIISEMIFFGTNKQTRNNNLRKLRNLK